MREPEAAAGSETGVEEEESHPPYMLIWAVLAVLMFGKVGVSLIGFAKPVAVTILVIISLVSALLVALYYMHLRFEPKILWLVAAAPLPLAAILIISVLLEF